LGVDAGHRATPGRATATALFGASFDYRIRWVNDCGSKRPDFYTPPSRATRSTMRPKPFLAVVDVDGPVTGNLHADPAWQQLAGQRP
jgi:hypothetical protein